MEEEERSAYMYGLSDVGEVIIKKKSDCLWLESLYVFFGVFTVLYNHSAIKPLQK